MAEVTMRPPLLLVSRRAMAYWALRAALGWLILVALQVTLWANGVGGSGVVHVVALSVTVVAALVHLIVMPQWRYRVHRWERTADAVYTQSGWITIERRIAPISRIQTVDSQVGPFERLFRLANVTVTTASAAGPVKIHGLDQVTARELLDDLIHTTQATTGDAT